MINFAHGEVYMIGAFISLIAFAILGYAGVTFLPLALLVVLLLSMVFTAAYGWAIERLAYRPLRGSFRLAALISAIGMSIFLQNYVQIFQGARTKSIQPLFDGGIVLSRGADFNASISYLQITIILVTIVLMTGFTLLIQKTPLGRAQRACEQDMGMAGLLGVNVDRTVSLTFVMGRGAGGRRGSDGRPSITA